MTSVVECAVEKVRVPEGRRAVNEERVRELAQSIHEVGLLQPLVVVPEGEGFCLVVGHHRLSAFRLLGRKKVPAIVMKMAKPDIELAEIDENLIRHDLSPAERATLMARRKQLYLARYPETGNGKSRNNSKDKNDKLSFLPPLAFSQEVAKKRGTTKRTVEREARRGEMIEQDVLSKVQGTSLDTGANLDVLARMDPRDQAEVVEYAQESNTSNLRVAARNMKRARTVQTIEAEPQPLPTGPWRVIVADPPWQYDKRDEDGSHRGTVDYPRMSIEEMCALEVPSIAHEDAILWLWTTNAHFQQAYQVVDAWGFQPKTVLTWVKSKMGLGDWLRGQTEHCIMAVRGRPTVQLTNQTTALHAPVREHSRKPDEFYRLVEGLCPGSRVELFSRTPREGWSRWGAEAERYQSS